MRSFTIGSVAGIPIRINVTLLVFLPVLAWLLSDPDQLAMYANAVEAMAPGTIDEATLQEGQRPLLLGIAAAVGLFASVLVHELGHSWTARRYDIGISSITLWIFGGMAHMEDLPEDWNVEFWIAVAGPITSVLLGGVLYAALFAVPAGVPLVAFLVGWLAVVNLTLAIFNMVPAFPMDGGRVLRALLARSRPYVDATRTAASIGRGFAILMAVVGILAFAPLLILVAMFVYVAATAESRTTVLRDLLRGLAVRDMLAETGGAGEAVSPDATVQSILEGMVAGRRSAVPVVEDGRPVGVLTVEAAMTVPPAERDRRRAEDVMTEEPPVLAPDDEAFEALLAFGQRGVDRVVVADGSRILGTLSQADVLTAIESIQGVGEVSRPELAPDGYA